MFLKPYLDSYWRKKLMDSRHPQFTKTVGLCGPRNFTLTHRVRNESTLLYVLAIQVHPQRNNYAWIFARHSSQYLLRAILLHSLRHRDGRPLQSSSTILCQSGALHSRRRSPETCLSTTRAKRRAWPLTPWFILMWGTPNSLNCNGQIQKLAQNLDQNLDDV